MAREEAIFGEEHIRVDALETGHLDGFIARSSKSISTRRSTSREETFWPRGCTQLFVDVRGSSGLCNTIVVVCGPSGLPEVAALGHKSAKETEMATRRVHATSRLLLAC
ncbi:hypothetical protein CRG98_003632 [Punica granatum]|uniref:Uncharacterized protein n=1 Tax=Punica granatum TaxID=22663 RepID=A0A2I0L5K8_PUNGR|nr:hypothetical protein CRG98_003632 [Punica granatum]